MNEIKNPQNKPLNDREELVVRLREQENLIYREIGVRLGVSGNMAAIIYVSARAKLKDFAENGEHALSLLHGRVRRALADCGLGSREQTRAAMESGRLSCAMGGSAIFWDGVMLRQLSRKTWVVLYEWAGKPAMPPGQFPSLKDASASAKLKGFAENGEHALSLLPGRVRRALADCGLDSREQARAAMESGRLSCAMGGIAIFWDGVMLRQLSRKTWVVLYEWAGKPAMPPWQNPYFKIRALDGH